MLSGPYDHLPRDVDFVDWTLERLRYDIEHQTLEVAISGPDVVIQGGEQLPGIPAELPARVEWRVEARFGHVVYLRLFSEWEVWRWEEWEAVGDLLRYFGEEPSLREVDPHLREEKRGTRLWLGTGHGIESAALRVAPPGTRLRAFVLLSASVALQWLCADVEVYNTITPPSGRSVGAADDGSEAKR